LLDGPSFQLLHVSSKRKNNPIVPEQYLPRHVINPSPAPNLQDLLLYKQKTQNATYIKAETIQYTKRIPPKITCINCTSDREYFLCGHDFPANFKPCSEHGSLKVPLVGTYKACFPDAPCPGWLCQRQEEENRKQFAEWSAEEKSRNLEKKLGRFF
jgi:hypothetical protein